MILLIHAPSFVSWISKPSFKFHYDSINSALKSSGNSTRINDLNSIMILLIPDGSFLPCGSHSHLNSIMILLIQTWKKKDVCFTLEFKFHYDSINSHQTFVSFMKISHLNSIMILLILDSFCCWFLWKSRFKFHYDSINSRPKIIPLFKPKNVSILSTSSKFNISFLSLIIYFCNTSYFRRFRLLSIPYIFCTIRGRQKPLIFQVDFVRHILLWNLFAKYAS